MAFPLQNKTAIVTGGSRGIGKAIALDVASKGANVLITYANSEIQAQEVCSEIEKHGVASIGFRAAGTDRSAPAAIVKAAVDKWTKIDIIINNAATGGDFSLLDTTEDQFEELTLVNFRFPLFLIKAAIPHFGPAPRIVNISSIYARSGHANCSVYSACKGALETATRSLATELGHKYNATINCVEPGPVNTDLWRKAYEGEEYRRVWEPEVQRTPAAPRVAEPHEVAHVVAFLCDEKTSWTTGSVINVNGGMIFV
ncbi:hypothetical protein N0V90_000454 [Kalmusia sp. IMI 367209]|nr:hypothetical protein N0V90_000454 [Kalmusia sp. IMI 367209]